MRLYPYYHAKERENPMKKRDRYYEIAAEHSAGLRTIVILPPVKERPAGSVTRGRAIPELGVIIVRRPDTLDHLRLFLHECAHCKLHQRVPPGTPYHWLELDAERYAFAALQKSGLEIPEKALEESRYYLFGELGADVRAGQELHPEVFDYIGPFWTKHIKQVIARQENGELKQTAEFLRGQGSISYEKIQIQIQKQ
jgi:hypothetical protein